MIRAATSGSSERRRHARLAAAAAFGLFAVPLAIRGTSEMAPELGSLLGSHARYLFAPMVLAWVPLLLLADRRGGWGGRLATLVIVFVAASSTGVTDRSLGPAWPDAVATARIAPASAPWRVRIPCDRL